MQALDGVEDGGTPWAFALAGDARRAIGQPGFGVDHAGFGQAAIGAVKAFTHVSPVLDNFR